MPKPASVPDIRIADYTYSLPEEKIAFFPLPERDASRLLVYRNGAIQEDRYKNIAAYLPEGSLMVFNNTRVVNARILFQKSTGGIVEVFCLEPHNMEMAVAMQQENHIDINCLVGGASKWKHGSLLEKPLTLNGKKVLLQAAMQERSDTHFVIRLHWNEPGICFAEILRAAGNVPLPPYIKREAGNTDSERYQTVYAQHEGSVAAPTAGLHFTVPVLESLQQKNIQTAFVTLHVGAGTFQPVKTERIAEHDMHGEWISLPRRTIETLLRFFGKGITATGTTTLRTLESLYWLGVKLIAEPGLEPPFHLGQWEAYTLPANFTMAESFQAVLRRMDAAETDSFTATTQLLVMPGYRLRVAHTLVTNFHQPQSTLLLLVAAVAGENWKMMYDYALQHDFRFLSYGDGCLISAR